MDPSLLEVHFPESTHPTALPAALPAALPDDSLTMSLVAAARIHSAVRARASLLSSESANVNRLSLRSDNPRSRRRREEKARQRLSLLRTRTPIPLMMPILTDRRALQQSDSSSGRRIDVLRARREVLEVRAQLRFELEFSLQRTRHQKFKSIYLTFNFYFSDACLDNQVHRS